MVSLFLLLGCNLSYIVDLFAALHELASASTRTLLKLASLVRAFLKPYGDTLNASLESFVHKALKDEQIECIHKIVCHGRDVLVVLPTGLRKSAIYQLISKGPYGQRHIKNRRKTPCFWLAYKVERYLHQVLLLKLTHYERNINRRTCFTK